jgi:hypothetical protein
MLAEIVECFGVFDVDKTAAEEKGLHLGRFRGEAERIRSLLWINNLFNS